MSPSPISIWWSRFPREALSKGFPIEEIHDQEEAIARRLPVHVQRVDLAHVGMRDPVCELDLGMNSIDQIVQGGETGPDHLQRHTLRVIGVDQILGLMDLTHAAGAHVSKNSEKPGNHLAFDELGSGQELRQDGRLEEGRVALVEPHQIQHLGSQAGIGRTRVLEIRRPLLGLERDRALKELLSDIPLRAGDTHQRSSSSARSHARANLQSASTVDRLMSSWAAISGFDKPQKNRSSTIFAWRGLSFSSLSRHA